MTTYTLWGFHPNYVGMSGKPYLIRLEIGSLRECRAEEKYRNSLGGWTLGTYRQDTDITTTAMQSLLDIVLSENFE